MFYERLKEICSRKNTTVTNLLKKLDLDSGNTGRWKKNRMPSGETLIKLSKELNVSADYFLGLTEEQNFKSNKTEEYAKMDKTNILALNEKAWSYLKDLKDMFLAILPNIEKAQTSVKDSEYGWWFLIGKNKIIEYTKKSDVEMCISDYLKWLGFAHDEIKGWAYCAPEAKSPTEEDLQRCHFAFDSGCFEFIKILVPTLKKREKTFAENETHNNYISLINYYLYHKNRSDDERITTLIKASQEESELNENISKALQKNEELFLNLFTKNKEKIKEILSN